MNEISRLIAEVQRARRAYLDRVAALSDDQGDFRRAPKEWTIAEITEHLVHAELGGTSLIWTAADGVRRGKPAWTGDLVHRGRTIEEIVERTWKPKETAPEAARPEWGGPLAYWVAALGALAPIVEGLAEALEGLDPETVVFPHPISGPLDARQRLEFLRFHLDRHRAQVEGVRSAAGVPAR